MYLSVINEKCQYLHYMHQLRHKNYKTFIKHKHTMYLIIINDFHEFFINFVPNCCVPTEKIKTQNIWCILVHWCTLQTWTFRGKSSAPNIHANIHTAIHASTTCTHSSKAQHQNVSKYTSWYHLWNIIYEYHSFSEALAERAAWS